MDKTNDIMSLRCEIITAVRTGAGYLQVLEYILQDFSLLHVVQWHFNDTVDKDLLVPIQNNETFYRSKDAALKLAHEVGNKLLENQY